MSVVDGLPKRVVVGANGAYWRDFGDFYSMCPVSNDNDPVEVVAVYARLEEVAELLRRHIETEGGGLIVSPELERATDLLVARAALESAQGAEQRPETGAGA